MFDYHLTTTQDYESFFDTLAYVSRQFVAGKVVATRPLVRARGVPAYSAVAHLRNSGAVNVTGEYEDEIFWLPNLWRIKDVRSYKDLRKGRVTDCSPRRSGLREQYSQWVEVPYSSFETMTVKERSQFVYLLSQCFIGVWVKTATRYGRARIWVSDTTAQSEW